MNCYVFGAGVSKSVGYPLGSELFDEIDRFVRQSGRCFDRFDYQGDWDRINGWLGGNLNPVIAQAYSTRNIEHIFTALDFVSYVRDDAFASISFAERNSAGRIGKAEAVEKYDKAVEDYHEARRILLWALEHYFAHHHQTDLAAYNGPEWDSLKCLGEKLSPGDVVITFNYDATIERVLLEQRKWSPTDGFGFELKFQESRYDSTPVNPWGSSSVKVLHLHGATGWYPRPAFLPGHEPHGSGPVSSDALGPAPPETEVSLSSEFLGGLGICKVDACLTDNLAVSTDRHIVIHPTFLKDYLSKEGVIPPLWRRAAEELRRAERIYVVGYSLPAADSAALTLLLTACDRGIARVVNPDPAVKMKLGRLLRTGDMFDGTATLEEWAAAGCSDRIPWRPRKNQSSILATSEAS